MDAREFKLLKPLVPNIPHVDARELDNQGSRTLLYGYDVDRKTWHVYLMRGRIHLVVYLGWDNNKVERHIHGFTHEAERLVPNKRLYPEACDLDFCNLLHSKGVSLPFTTFDEKREPKQFHGYVVGEEMH